MKIVNHRLYYDDGTPYPFRASPNMRGSVKHEYLVMHYTAGSSAEQSINWLTDPRSKASAHLVIGQDGSITQLVPFDTIAWHAGTSSWLNLNGLNNYSLGIELDNAGPLNRSADGKWRSWFGGVYSDDQVIETNHKHETEKKGWQLYTPQQLYVALDVAELLVRHYRLKDILGHDDIAPGRKTDPGPAFPMRAFRGRLLGRSDSSGEQEIYVNTVILNIRTGPGTQYPALAEGPLPRNTRLQALTDAGTWMQIDVLDEIRGVRDIQGWVNKRYITRS